MGAPLRLAAAIVLSGWLCACSGGRPSIKMIGVAQAEQHRGGDDVAVLVEVMNPSQTELVLSRFDYNLDCDVWAPVEGSVSLSRSVGPGASEVVQIPIRPRAAKTRTSAAGHSACELSGRLYAVDQKLERSWRVRTQKRFRKDNAALFPAVRVTTTR